MDMHQDYSSHVYVNWSGELTEGINRPPGKTDLYDNVVQEVCRKPVDRDHDYQHYTVESAEGIYEEIALYRPKMQSVESDEILYNDIELYRPETQSVKSDENIYEEIELYRPKTDEYKILKDSSIYHDPRSTIYGKFPEALKTTYGFPGPSSEHCYNKRSGTADMTGELFEVGITMFLLLKGIFETAGFELATNVGWAGAFDDIVFKFKDKEMLTERMCLFQLKHKSRSKKANDQHSSAWTLETAVDAKRKSIKLLGHQALCSDTGDFSLLKYFDSYCQISKAFSLHYDNISSSNSINDCTFIIYTNAAFDSRDFPDSNVSDEKQEILNSGGADAEIFSIHSGSKEYQLFSRLEEYRKALENITSKDLSYEEIKSNLKDFHQIDHCKRLLKFKKEDEFRKVLVEQLSEELDIQIWEEFLKKLYLYTKQTSEEELDDLIKEKIKLYCKTSDMVTEELFSKLKEAIIHWWRKERHVINENSTIFWHLIMDVSMSSMLLPMHLKLSGIIGLRFRFVKEITSKVTHVVTKHCSALACLRVKQSLTGMGYIIVDSCTMVEFEEEILAVWEYGPWCNVLIIEGNRYDMALSTKISYILLSSPDKKLVVVGSVNNPTIKKLNQQFQIETYKDQFYISELEHDSKNLILDSKLIFQGCEVNLKSLASEDIIHGVLTDDYAVRLLSDNQKVEVGHKLDEMDKIYISRAMIRKGYVDERIFSGNEHLKLAITGITKEELQCLVPSDKIADITDGTSTYKGDNFQYFIIYDEHNFISLSDIHDNLHWIEKIKDSFIWKYSKGDITSIKSYINDDNIKYDNPLDIMHVCGKIVLIIGEPGMGKSTELCHISYELKNKDPTMWIVKVNLNDHTDYLSQDQPKPLNLLLKAGDFSSLFEKTLFMYQVFVGGNIIIMFDGFDEICPNYYDVIIKMLRILSETKVRNIFITSRPIMRDKLEQEFSTLSFSFENFTENDQKTFLSKFWKVSDSSPYDLHDFISELLKLPKIIFGDELNDLTGNPLHIKMLAEVFQAEALQYSETGENKLPKTLNLVELYNKFIDKNWEFYYEKLKIDITKVGLSADYEEKKRLAKQNYMICALIALLEIDKIKQLKNSKKFIKKYNEFVEKFINGDDKAGIIVDIVNEKPVFLHQTFAEYFLAMLFTENIVCSLNKNENKFYNTIGKLFGTIEQTTFYKTEIFFNFQIVRSFFDMILALKYNLHIAVLNQDKALIQSLLLEEKDVNECDEGGRSPLHLAVTNFLNILEDEDSRRNAEEILLLLLNHGADTNIKDKVLHWRPLRLAVEIKAWSCVVLLLERQVKMKDLAQIKQGIADVEYINTMLIEAGKQGSVKLASFMLKCGVNIDHKLEVDNSQFTLLLFATKHGKLSLVKFLVENKANIEERDTTLRRTPLMWAAEKDNVSVAEFLITKGANVNECDTDDNTATLIAARCGQYGILKLLAQHGADMTACNRYGNSALHQASGCGSVSCVSLLLKMIPIDSRNTIHNTPLMTAARHGKCNVIEVLTKHGADLNVCDKNGNSTLHYAAESDTTDCVKFFLDFGLQINHANHMNRTTLWCAAQLGKIHVTRLLCEYGADLNVEDNVLLETPLHVAVRCGHFDIVKCLIQYKAAFISRSKWSTTPLHTAAKLGHVNIAQYLIRHGASLKICTRIGGTPLHMAARWGQLEMADCLIQYGASITAFDFEGNSPLHIAVKRGHLEVMDLLIKSGASLTLCDHEGHSPLQSAAASGNLHIIEYLLHHEANLSDCDKLGHTPLHMAAARGNSHVVKFLLQHGADTEIFDYDGHTPLHIAVKWGHLNIVKLLTGYGISLDACDNCGNTPLHVAATWGHKDIVEWLIIYGASLTINNNEGHTPLHVAIMAGQFEIMTQLSVHHESIRPCKEEGHTPLHVATKWGQLNMVSWFILIGANLTDTDNEGKTPMHVAANEGHLQILKFLFKQGASLEGCDYEGHELLHLAARSGHLEIVDLLIKLGANMMARNKSGSTPLHLAMNWCHFDVIKCLVEHGASLIVTDNRGNTPLHIAARWGDLEIINFLMQCEPSLTAKDNEGYTPLHVAIRWGHKHIADLFKEHGASLTSCDNTGNSPLLIATSWGHLHIIEWLIQNEVASETNNAPYSTILPVAVKWGHLEIIDFCLKHGANVTVCDRNGYTPLHIAAKCGHLEVAKILVSHGASVTAYNEDGEMPVHISVRWAQLHVVEWLVQFSPGLTALTKDGFTLLHVAARWGHLHIIEWLEKKDATLIHIHDKKGNTPVDVARTWDRQHIVKYLLENSANETGSE